MIELNAIVMGVSACYSHYIYFNQRSHRNHGGLTGIDIDPWLIVDIHDFVVRANAATGWPRDIGKVKCIVFYGGSTHRAFLRHAESYQWFLRFAEIIGLEFAFFCAHRRASGRFDFHVLACMSRDGLKRSKRALNKLARIAARQATQELNEARLAAGNRLTIGNLTEDGEVYFLRPPATPEPAPEMAPAPELVSAPAPDPVTEPKPEPAPPLAPKQDVQITILPVGVVPPGNPTKSTPPEDKKPTSPAVKPPFFPPLESPGAVARRKKEQEEKEAKRLKDEEDKRLAENAKRLWRDLLTWIQSRDRHELDDVAPPSWAHFANRQNGAPVTFAEIPDLARLLARSRAGKITDEEELNLQDDAFAAALLRYDDCVERNRELGHGRER